MSKYAIIDLEILEKRIEELEKELKTLGDIYEEEIHAHGFISGEINQLKKIKSQSTPLIPEIEKALYAKGAWYEDEVQDYISNLKLNI